ncbi:MAG TPA: hypothetical protein VIV61_19160, partial [Candidatus Ozemobacteraceae bacterium]
MKTRESGFGRLALLAIGIPILILAVIGGHTLGRFEENADRQRLSRLDKDLDTVVSAVSENAYLLDGLRHRISLVRQPGPDTAALETAFRELAKRDGIGVRVYRYTGDRLTGSIPEGPAAPLYTRLMGLLHASGSAFLAGQREVRNDLLTRFGPGSRLEIIRRYRGVLVRFGRPGKSRGAYFWNDFPDGTAIIATIHRVPEAFERFQRLARRQISPYAGFAYPQKDLWAPPAGLSADQMQVAFGKCRAEGRLQTRHAGHEWVFCQSQQGLLWCVADHIPAGSSAPGMHSLVIAATLLAGLLLGFWLLARLETAPGRR